MKTNEGKEVLDDWASAMLKIINSVVDDEVEGGIGGLGSTDGVYLHSDEVLEILIKFIKLAGYEVGDFSLIKDSGITFIWPSLRGNIGLLIQHDEEFPHARILSWYDEAKF